MPDRELTLAEQRRPQPRKRPGFVAGVVVGVAVAAGVPMLIGCACLIALEVLIVAGRVPSPEAVAGGALHPSTVELLEAEGVIEPGEEVLYFFSDGFLSFRADGNLFTPRRVVSYWEAGDDLMVEQADYHDVELLEIHHDDGWLGDTQIHVHRFDGSWFRLLVSNEDGRDDAFYERLERAWLEGRNGPPVREGNQLPPELIADLVREEVLEPGEQVAHFYSKSCGSPLVDGNLLTDRAVVGYWVEEGELESMRIPLEHVVAVQPEWGAGRHGVTDVEVRCIAGRTLRLWLSPEHGGDRVFVRALEAACDLGE